MRIATFNVENLDDPGVPAIGKRIEALRPHLLRLKADILCLQEVHGQKQQNQPRQLLALQQLLAGTQYAQYNLVHTRTTSNQAYDERNLVILAKYTIPTIQQVRNQYVSKLKYKRVTSDPPDSGAVTIGWERPILHAQVQVAGGVLHIINVHLKSRIPADIPGQKQTRTAPSGATYEVFKTSAGWAEGYFISSMKRVGQALEVRLLVDDIFDQDAGARVVVCGDFNAEPGEVPVEAILGRVANTENPDLFSRQMIPCNKTIADSSQFTHLHHGEPNLLDHILISRSLLGAYRGAEIYNELLYDETIRYASDDKFPDSDHAPFVLELDVPAP